MAHVVVAGSRCILKQQALVSWVCTVFASVAFVSAPSPPPSCHLASSLLCCPCLSSAILICKLRPLRHCRCSFFASSSGLWRRVGGGAEQLSLHRSNLR